MAGYNVKLSGLDEVFQKLDVAKFEQGISDELTAFGFDVVRDAKQNLSTNKTIDEGFLTNSINAVLGNLSIEIVVNADYAAYVEFGTRKFAAAYVATLPADWQEFARQYKGKGGGSFQQLVAAIVKWVARKGITGNYSVKTQKRTGKKVDQYAEDYAAAYPIARSILINGIKAQPFLFPAYEKNRPELIKRLKSLLNA